MMPLDRFFKYPNKRRRDFVEFNDDENSQLTEDDDEERHEYDEFASELQDDDSE